MIGLLVSRESGRECYRGGKCFIGRIKQCRMVQKYNNEQTDRMDCGLDCHRDGLLWTHFQISVEEQISNFVFEESALHLAASSSELRKNGTIIMFPRIITESVSCCHTATTAAAREWKD